MFLDYALFHLLTSNRFLLASYGLMKMANRSPKSLPSLAKLDLVRRAIEISQSARDHGNDPFGALLADAAGKIVLEAENSAIADNTATAHAEFNLVSKASKLFTSRQLSSYILYSSCEPCAMCAGAIFFVGIRKVVYALSGELLATLWKTDTDEPIALLDLSCRQVFESCTHYGTEVVGPLLEQEALKPHLGFWETRNRGRFKLDVTEGT
jgi:tRNA(Arg) A34 adenosine deaminase TadA